MPLQTSRASSRVAGPHLLCSSRPFSPFSSPYLLCEATRSRGSGRASRHVPTLSLTFGSVSSTQEAKETRMELERAASEAKNDVEVLTARGDKKLHALRQNLLRSEGECQQLDALMAHVRFNQTIPPCHGSGPKTSPRCTQLMACAG